MTSILSLAEKYELDVHVVENIKSDLLQKKTKDLIFFSHQNLIYKMIQVMTKFDKKNWHVDFARKLKWDLDHLFFKLNLKTKTSFNTRFRIVSKNFYIFALFKFRKSSNSEQ